MLKTRPSEADRNLKCAGSLLKTEFPVDEKSDEARDGRAKHEIAARYVTGVLTHGDFKKYADYYQVDATELEHAAAGVKAMWEKLKEHFPNPKVEQKLSGLVSAGTEDVVSFDGAAELDWKFGYSFDEHPNQLLGYADGVLVALNEQMPECGYIKAYEVWIRHMEYREYRFTKAAIEGYRAAMLEQIKNTGKQYNPGGHCNFCPNVNDCEARTQYIRATTTALIERPKDNALWKREDLVAYYDRIVAWDKAKDKYFEYLKEELKDGPIRIDDKREVALVTQKTTSVFADKAWPILTGKYGYSKEDMARCLSVKKKEMVDVIRDKAGKGKKGAMEKALMEDLKDASATWEGTKEVRRVRSIK